LFTKHQFFFNATDKGGVTLDISTLIFAKYQAYLGGRIKEKIETILKVKKVNSPNRFAGLNNP
jgi:hypothetical protein